MAVHFSVVACERHLSLRATTVNDIEAGPHSLSLFFFEAGPHGSSLSIHLRRRIAFFFSPGGPLP
ncbi:hypothetical protein EWM64_g10759 [Hericium alpestre]|uniref:Uncharacterized protein n=1 Tax=Hericium alpestre TaxID=135208 RepID=A0A4Y9ZHF6_9AGAM|nr:hypothetical protein EWM64_g10759 [Hericium alpestre]